MPGLGKVISRGTVTLIPPTQIIEQPIEAHTIDGVEIDVPARARDRGAGRDAHVLSRPRARSTWPRTPPTTCTTSIPIRGAAGARCQRLGQVHQRGARSVRAPKADVVFAQHHWPVWGSARVLDYLGQAARPLQVPARPDAAADEPRAQGRPRSPSGSRCRRASASEWHVRGYYGTFSHNAKAVYQRYLGWYDANPANLNPLPPVRAREEDRRLHGRRRRRRSRGRARISPRASTAGWRRP